VGILTREQIDAIDDLTAQMVEVDVPEWGGSAFLRPLEVGELDDYSNKVMRARQKGEGLTNFRAELVAKCLCDAKGVRLYSDADVAILAKKNGVVVNRLYEAADKLNDIGPKKIEDIAGNSHAGQSDSSSSDLPAISNAPFDKSIECPSQSSASGGLSTGTTSPSAESGNKPGESSSPSA
jgi:hypothetical protein